MANTLKINKNKKGWKNGVPKSEGKTMKDAHARKLVKRVRKNMKENPKLGSAANPFIRK